MVISLFSTATSNTFGFSTGPETSEILESRKIDNEVDELTVLGATARFAFSAKLATTFDSVISSTVEVFILLAVSEILFKVLSDCLATPLSTFFSGILPP